MSKSQDYVGFITEMTEIARDLQADIERLTGQLTEEPEDKDGIIASVIDKFRKRSERGIEKYGVTLEREDLSHLDWLVHMQEEMMDGVNYLERLIRDEQKEKSFRPMPGELAMCRHGKVGRITSVALDGSRPIWRGTTLFGTAWQTVDPRPVRERLAAHPRTQAEESDEQ